MREVLENWLGSPIQELQSGTKQLDLMHAVARGAAYYGLARRGKGVRIRGGVPRSYYVGIESSLPAVPGLPAPYESIDSGAFRAGGGLEGGTATARFALVVGEPAEFRFFSSVTRKDDAPGTLLDESGTDMEELAPVQVSLAAQTETAAEGLCPSHLKAT